MNTETRELIRSIGEGTFEGSFADAVFVIVEALMQFREKYGDCLPDSNNS